MLCGDEIMLVDFGLAAEVGKVLEEGEEPSWRQNHVEPKTFEPCVKAVVPAGSRKCNHGKLEPSKYVNENKCDELFWEVMSTF